MEEKNKYVLFDALLFGFKNSLAYFRPVFISLLTIFAGGLALVIVGLLILGFSRVIEAVRLMSIAPELVKGILFSFSGIVLVIPLILLIFIPHIIFAYNGLLIYDAKMTQRVSFPPFSKIIKTIIVYIIALTIGCVGLLLFIAPGVFWFIRTSLASYIILDTNAGIIETFRRSINLTKGHGWIIASWMLLILVASKVWIIALCFPFTTFAGAYLYNQWKK